jgi:formylglycine-generating enzyme required for sulfatase activity
MNDPAAARSPKGWPLLAIALLIVLLSVFLFLRWRKRDEGPAVVKDPVPVPVARTPDPPPPPPPVPPVVPAPPTPAPESEFDLRLKELKQAVDEKRWDAASASLAAAKKLRPEDPGLAPFETAIAEARKKEAAEMAEAARKLELRQKQELAWGAVREKAEKARAEDLWDAALGAIDAFVKEYPGTQRDSEVERTRKQIQGLQEESDKLFKRDLAEAQKLFAEGRYSQAISTAENALKFYPERKAQVREFQERAREVLFEKSMVRIPSTACWIGSEERPDEKPLRQVKLPAFLMDKYEVTNEEYYSFVTATDHEAPAVWGGRKPPKGRERHPVVFVTWDDAAAYAKWAGKRLPTAEEWEVAARGPDKREFPWGAAFQEKEEIFNANCLEYWQLHKSQAPGTTAVDLKDFDIGVSAFGVFGMSGNVWEWTATAAPATGTKPPAEFRILKGGSFMTPQKALRCANVLADDPRLPHPDVGFRCARDVK